MEVINSIGRELNYAKIESAVREYNIESKDKDEIYLSWCYIYNNFESISEFKSNMTNQVCISIFKVDNTYFELYVIKTEKQEYPSVIQLTLDEYEKSVDSTIIEGNITHSTLKIKVTNGLIGNHPTYYFKIIGKYNSNEESQKVRLSWLYCQHNLQNAQKNIPNELFK